MNNLSFVCVFLFPVFNTVGVFSVAFVDCTLTLCQVFCLSSSEVFLMTYHGFNYGIIIFCLGGFGVWGPVLDTWGFFLLSRALWSGAKDIGN